MTRSVGWGQEGSQTHSEPPSTLRVGGSDGGEQEDSQEHSEPGGVVEGSGRTAKHTESRGEWWRGAGGQPSTLRAGRSG